MIYPKEIKRIVFRPSIIMFGDAIEFIGENRAAENFLVIHENDHYISVTSRSKPSHQAFIHISNVNCLEYADVKPTPVITPDKPAKSPKRPNSKS